jgi:hypothetical protein
VGPWHNRSETFSFVQFWIATTNKHQLTPTGIASGEKACTLEACDIPTSRDATIKGKSRMSRIKIKIKIKMHAVILSCAYYNMGIWRFGAKAILHVTGVDWNGHEWTGVDKIPGSLCLTGFAKKEFQRERESPNSNPQAPEKHQSGEGRMTNV